MIRKQWHRCRRLFALTCLVGELGLGRSVRASDSYALERYHPTRPGEDTFWVDAPSDQTLTRRYALGLTGDYDNKPLVVRQTTGVGAPGEYAVVRHEFVAHLQGSVSFRRRLVLSADLPVVLVHRGDPLFAVKPGSEISQGDLRLSGLVSLLPAADKRGTGLFVSGDLFVPLRGRALSGDRLPQFSPKIIVTQKLSRQLVLAASLGALIRERASLSRLPKMPGNTVGTEIQAGLRLALVNPSGTWSVGPELVAGTTTLSHSFFKHDGSSLEILGGAHWAPHPAWRIGVGLGAGLLTSPGTPLFRGLVRVSFSPAAPLPIAAPPQVASPMAPNVAVTSQTSASQSAPVSAPLPAPSDKMEPTPDLRPPARIVIKRDALEVPQLEFELGRAKLVAQSVPTLLTLVALLKDHEEIKRIVIEAHTDDVGHADVNRRLSFLRARTIRKLLIRNGIAGSRLVTRGFGSSRPRVANDTENHRQMNRRVEFKIRR